MTKCVGDDAWTALSAGRYWSSVNLSISTSDLTSYSLRNSLWLIWLLFFEGEHIQPAKHKHTDGWMGGNMNACLVIAIETITSSKKAASSTRRIMQRIIFSDF